MTACEVAAAAAALQVEEQTEGQRQVNKIFPQDSDCSTDFIISPIDKHETQSSPVGGTALSVLPFQSSCQTVSLLLQSHSSISLTPPPVLPHLQCHSSILTQVLKLLSVSYRLLEFWELPSVVLPGASRTLISPKLSELKEGVRLLFKVSHSLSHPLMILQQMV